MVLLDLVLRGPWRGHDWIAETKRREPPCMKLNFLLPLLQAGATLPPPFLTPPLDLLAQPFDAQSTPIEAITR